MKDTFTLNDNVIKAKQIDFNFICMLSDNGIQVDEIGDKVISAVRVYVAYCLGTKTEIAGDEIQKFVIEGGDLNEIIDVFSDKLEESDFFRALAEKMGKAETPKKSRKKISEEVSE